jgi:hypothetical protein
LKTRLETLRNRARIFGGVAINSLLWLVLIVALVVAVLALL